MMIKIHGCEDHMQEQKNGIQAVIFDLDGLLIDSEKMYYQAFASLARKYGENFPLEEYASGFSGHSLKENIQALINRYTLPVTTEEAHTAVTEYLRDSDLGTIMLKPGAEELILFLKEKRIKVCLATSGNEKRARDILRMRGLESVFDSMVFREDIRKGKPEPEIFLKACEKADVPAQDCLVLEDSEAGILAAVNAGMKVICIPDLRYPGEEYAQKTWMILRDLDEVRKLLEEIQ